MTEHTDLADTAHLAQPQHFRGLYQALLSNDQQAVTRLVIPMLPTVMQRADRYGKLADEYGVEVQPLLGVLIGTGIPHIDSRASLEAAHDGVELAIDQAVLSTRLVRRELPEVLQPKLDERLEEQSNTIRSASRALLNKAHEQLKSRPVAIFLNATGKLSTSHRFAKLHRVADNPECIDVPAATVHAASLRRLWQLDDALETLDHVLAVSPRSTEALTCRGAVLADAGRWAEAHRLATETFNLQVNRHTARLVLRTSKALGDSDAFARASAFLGGTR